MSEHDEQFMREALGCARECLRKDEMPVGALLMTESGGFASYPGSLSRFGTPYFGHAEMLALNQLNGRFKRGQMEIFTTMEPCVMCMGAILHFPISRVVYALEDPHGGATARLEKWVPPRHQGRLPEIVGGVLREESRMLMRQWFETTRNEYWSSTVGRSTPLYKLCME